MKKLLYTKEDLMNFGFSEYKAKQIIRTVNSRIRKSGGMIISRSAAPKELVEKILGVSWDEKDEGGAG